MTRFTSVVLFVTATLFLAGCPEFEPVETHDMNQLVCDSYGCVICEGSSCYQYSCDVTNQCPAGYSCSSTQSCIPSASAPGGGGGATSPAPTQTSTQEPTETKPCLGQGCSGEPVPECTADSDCGAGKQCATGTCVEKAFPVRPEGTCQFNMDCGPSGTCINAACYFPANADGCPEGSHESAGLCFPTEAAGECSLNSECDAQEICINTSCRHICESDAECSPRNICGVTGLCELDTRPQLQCLGNTDCTPGLACVDGRCLTGCSAESVCDSERESCGFGFCMPTADCFNGSDCSESLDCIDGLCDTLAITAQPTDEDELSND
jgi:Cys-rich repeat protein